MSGLIYRDRDGLILFEWGGNLYQLSDSLAETHHQGRVSVLIEILDDFIANSSRCPDCDGTGSLTLARMTSDFMPIMPLETDCIDCTACDGRGRILDA